MSKVKTIDASGNRSETGGDGWMLGLGFVSILTPSSPFCLYPPDSIQWPDPSINRGTYVWEHKVQVVCYSVLAFHAFLFELRFDVRERWPTY